MRTISRLLTSLNFMFVRKTIQSYFVALLNLKPYPKVGATISSDSVFSSQTNFSSISCLTMKRLRLKFAVSKAVHIIVPASFFGMILGLVGLGSCWRVAAKLWHLPAWIGESIMLIGVAVWFVLLVLYVSKWLWAREDALAEFEHPVVCGFIGLVPV